MSAEKTTWVRYHRASIITCVAVTGLIAGGLALAVQRARTAAHRTSDL